MSAKSFRDAWHRTTCPGPAVAGASWRTLEITRSAALTVVERARETDLATGWPSGRSHVVCRRPSFRRLAGRGQRSAPPGGMASGTTKRSSVGRRSRMPVTRAVRCRVEGRAFDAELRRRPPLGNLAATTESHVARRRTGERRFKRLRQRLGALSTARSKTDHPSGGRQPIETPRSSMPYEGRSRSRQ
jgi:hypothetical protein